MGRTLSAIPLIIVFTLMGTTCTSEGAWDTIRRQQSLVSQNLIWRQRVPLTLDNSFPASDELVDFPVLVLLDDTNIDMDLFAPGGRDIRFHAEPIDGRMPHEMPALPHEVEHWDPDGVSAVWVRVPRIPAGSPDTRIWLYLDNPTATDRQRPADVWSNGYVGVWHLNEAGPPYRDSGPNALHGTTWIGGYTASERVEGPAYGYAQDFRGPAPRDRGIVISAAAPIDDISPFTWSLLARRQPGQVGNRLISKDHRDWWIDNGPTLHFQVNHDPQPEKLFRRSDVLPAFGSWDSFAVSWDGGIDPSGIRIFVNGSPSIGTSGVPTSGGERRSDAGIPLIIGNAAFGSPPTNALEGAISSVQLSSVARSSGWIRATHRGFTGSFVSIGAPEAVQYR